MAHLGIWSRKDPWAPMLDPLIAGLKRRGLCFATLNAHPEAVSYTHLRAHETVLDLVCRLLLEKKKETKYRHAPYYSHELAELQESSVTEDYTSHTERH